LKWSAVRTAFITRIDKQWWVFEQTSLAVLLYKKFDTKKKRNILSSTADQKMGSPVLCMSYVQLGYGPPQPRLSVAASLKCRFWHFKIESFTNQTIEY
jgi:hypothetical protein